MDWQVDCVAVIPCLNEEQTIANLVSEVKKHVPSILVIDDGSTDNTAPAASEAGATVIRHNINLGKGASLTDGSQWATKHRFKWALTLDGDGQHSPDDIPAFFSAALARASLIPARAIPRASAAPRWRRKSLATALQRSAVTPNVCVATESTSSVALHGG